MPRSYARYGSKSFAAVLHFFDNHERPLGHALAMN